MTNFTQDLKRYGIAIASVVIALLLMLILDPILHLRQASFLLFFGAVTISALYGGQRSGIVATFLAAILVNYYFLDPQPGLDVTLASGLRMMLFIVEGILISWLVGTLRMTQQQVRKSFNQLKARESEIQALNQSLQRRVNELQTLFDIIPINIAIAEDADCRVIKVNPTFSDLLQIPTSANASATPPPEQSPPPYKFYQNGQEIAGNDLPQQYAAKHGVEVRHTEIDLVRPDKTVFNLYGHAIPLFDELGRSRGSVGVYVDITERKRVETALHKLVECSKITGPAFFEAVVRILAELFQVRYAYVGEVPPDSPDRVRTIAAWVDGQPGNNIEYDLADTPCEQVIQNQTCFYPRHVAQLFPQDTLLADLGIESYMGTPLRASDGQVLGLLNILHDQPLDEFFNPEALIEIFAGKTAAELQREQAIAELRRSEERYRYLAESIPQLVWTANIQGTLMDINQRWSEYTGLSLTEVQRAGWQCVVHPDDLPTLQEKWAIAQQNRTHYQAEGRMRGVDGIYRWYLHQAIPVKDSKAEITKWFGTATDIEDVKQLEQQRIQLLKQEQAAREAAEAANRIKDEFLSILSHELRSPLNPILGWSQLLQSQKMDEAKTLQGLLTIERNAKLQTQLIDDLLDVAKILRGKIILDEAPVDLVTVIEAALEVVKMSAQAKSIALKLEFKDTCQVKGDQARLQQIFWNLLTNAVKFTPQGGQVEIQLEQVDNYAQITITDTGKGINPDFLPHIFESFYQENVSITRQYGGLGLGLSIVKYLVDAHGGTIIANSLGEGQGARFTVQFPLLNSRSLLNSTDKLATAEIDLSGIKVLAVDDSQDSRELLATLLATYGAQVRVVASAGEVLNYLNTFKPDVLVCDISMPHMDGYALLKKVRGFPDDQGGCIPAIAVTAHARKEDAQRALDSGFQQHLAKPIEPKQLALSIIQLAQKSSS